MSAPYILSVIAGPNAGARLPLAQGSHVIGGGPKDSVVLDGVEDAALKLTLRGETLHIDQSNGRVVYFGQPDAKAAAGNRQLPAVLQLGDETLVAIARATPLPPPKRSPVMMMIVALAAFGLGLVGSANLKVDLGTPGVAMTASAMETLARPPSSPRPVAAPSAQVRCDEACAMAAVTELRAALDAAGMSDMQLVQDGTVLRISGNLPPTKREVWRDLRLGFEARHGQNLQFLVTVAETAVQVNPLALTVASAWFGPSPEIRSSTGEVLRAGDVTRDGWSIEAIAPGLVTLRRGDALSEVRF